MATKGKTAKGLVNPLELGRETIRPFVQAAKKGAVDDINRSGKTFLEQLLGFDFKKSNKTATEAPAQTQETAQAQAKGHVEIFNSQKHHGASERAPKPRSEAAINYHAEIAQNRERASRKDMGEMQQNIRQIKDELARLVASSQELKLEFAEVSVEQSTPTVGQYHLTFFEWMLAVIRSAREKVEDSGAWLGAVQGKGAKKGYWGMFKKHGTSFGLSGERAVATQVG